MEEDLLILRREAGEGDPEGVEGAGGQRYTLSEGANTMNDWDGRGLVSTGWLAEHLHDE